MAHGSSQCIFFLTAINNTSNFLNHRCIPDSLWLECTHQGSSGRFQKGQSIVRDDISSHVALVDIWDKIPNLSCPTCCNPMDCSPPGSSVHGILQARILEWVTLPSSRGSSWPRDQTHISWVSWIAGRFFTTEPPQKPQIPSEMVYYSS